ncbi:FG-GAP-like repeat-containing protein [Glycomyces terrestris]|uniref:VCBS repeat-containing protein n=1 Tax=Glycomyces terrestris TaxID=2493553 RepID=A0A426US25_9ACTN|nr:FG-GAP-like repeat-containing protein [Glycomyces terrestris]RRR96108.1 VCBS repeat-containing protein [Glycomyces terrestris]
MQRNSTRRRRLLRAAALAAGAALIAAPGTAAAQTAEAETAPGSAPDSASDAAPETAAAETSRDYDGDGHDDLLTIRRNGRLILHAGNGDGTFDPGVALGHGWGAYDMSAAGDLTGDGLPDLLARENETGALYTYPGDGAGGFTARLPAGSGWNTYGMFTAAGDFDGDGVVDLLGVRESDDVLHLFHGLGDGRFGARTVAGSGWDGWDSLTTLGDVDQDGCDDVLGREQASGQYTVFLGNCAGGFGATVASEAAFTPRAGGYASDVAGGGDYNGDGLGDVLAVDGRSGELSLTTLTGDPEPVVDAVGLGTGWSDERLPAVPADWSYDYGVDGKTDVYARRASDGALISYTGNGSGSFSNVYQVGTGWAGLTLVETAGDVDEDGFQDVIARSADGVLWLYRGTGDAGGLTGPVRIGSGWNSFDAIVSGHDFNGDGWTDLVARSAAAGTMHVYSGHGDGTFEHSLQFGVGWDALRDLTMAGDLDHDGRADLLGVRESDGCLYLYRGNGSSVSEAVKVGCGWDGLDAIAAVGDFSGDGHADIVARRAADGHLFLYRGDANGNFTTPIRIGTGWNGVDAIA